MLNNPWMLPVIDSHLRRQQRGRIDLLLSVNSLSVEVAKPPFTWVEQAWQAAKMRVFGWSTDFSASVVQRC